MKLLYKDLVKTAAIELLMNDDGIDDFKLRIKLAKASRQYAELKEDYINAQTAIIKKSKASILPSGQIIVQPNTEIKDRDKRKKDKDERTELFTSEQKELDETKIDISIEPIDLDYIAEKTKLTALMLGDLLSLGILYEKGEGDVKE